MLCAWVSYALYDHEPMKKRGLLKPQPRFGSPESETKTIYEAKTLIDISKTDTKPSLLFLLYVNDVGNSVPNIPVKLYADDTNLFIYGKTTDVLINDAKSGVTKLLKWFSDNKLCLSIDKNCFSAFGVPDHDKNKLKLKVNNDDIKQVKSTKYIGIIIDSNLTWEDHIDYLYKTS